MKYTLVLTLATGCLSVPQLANPMCESTADCTGPGEVCEEGVCWGDPPAGTFAATISPPSERPDLVPVDFPTLAIPPDGWLGQLMLEPATSFAGRLEAFCAPPMDCSSRTSLGATITITRPSLIANGPAFRAVVASHGGAVVGASFQTALPRSHSEAEAYTVTIVPEGRGDMPDGTVTAAQLVPPRRMKVLVTDQAAQQVIELGTPDSPIVVGTLSNAGGFGLASYRVVALGRWDASDTPVEVSTVDYTGTDGKFHLVLATDLVGTVELVAKPYNTVAQTLHLGGLDATTSMSSVYIVQPANGGNPQIVDVHVTAMDGSGHVQDVSGARVTIDGSVQAGPPLGKFVSMSASDTTDDTGHVKLFVLDGPLLSPSYKLRIVPPASSPYGAIYAHDVTVGPMEVALPGRVALRGVIADADGTPLSGVSVTAHPSLGFAWNLDPDAQQFLSEIPAATTTTPNTGEFVVWVDGTIGKVFGHYDVSFEPSDNATAPAWSIPVDVPRDNSTSVSLDSVSLPAPAYIHGHLVDPNMAPIDSGEIKLFQVLDDTSLCAMVAHPPPSCPIPAPLLGRGTSDETGELRLTLPRP